MNVFEQVRNSISARDAAEHYGIKVRRNGMACCPFHPDKHPSMKLDQRFHCFGCQADGDAVNFTARMFGLGNYDAAVKLLNDFGISYEDQSGAGQHTDRKKKQQEAIRQAQRERLARVEKQFKGWISYAVDTLVNYQRLLEAWKEEYRPAAEDSSWHPLFEEALQNLSQNEYHFDILLNGNEEEKLAFSIRREKR